MPLLLFATAGPDPWGCVMLSQDVVSYIMCSPQMQHASVPDQS